MFNIHAYDYVYFNVIDVTVVPAYVIHLKNEWIFLVYFLVHLYNMTVDARHHFLALVFQEIAFNLN